MFPYWQNSFDSNSKESIFWIWSTYHSFCFARTRKIQILVYKSVFSRHRKLCVQRMLKTWRKELLCQRWMDFLNQGNIITRGMWTVLVEITKVWNPICIYVLISISNRLTKCQSKDSYSWYVTVIVSINLFRSPPRSREWSMILFYPFLKD